MEKLNIAFLYPKASKWFSGRHFDNLFYRFFFKGLAKSKRARTDCIPAGDSLDLTGYDAVIYWNEKEVFKKYPLCRKDVVKLVMSGDAHGITFDQLMDWYNEGIRTAFFYQPECYVRKFLPDEFDYKVIVFGMDEKVYKPRKKFEKRRRDKILLTGTTGSAIHRKGDPRPPKGSARFYNLRNMCARHTDVDYVSWSKGSKFTGNRYAKLLNQYQAAIGACTKYPVHKYFEVCLAGCLAFLEKCEGVLLYGFRNGENCIFINEDNYQQKFYEYLSDVDNPKWSKIAQAGRELVLKYYEQSVQVDKLIDVIENKIRERNGQKKVHTVSGFGEHKAVIAGFGQKHS